MDRLSEALQVAGKKGLLDGPVPHPSERGA
jgi:hypothetical protein